MIRKRISIFVIIMIISSIFSTFLSFASEEQDVRITENTSELKQIESSTLNVSVTKDGGYGVVLLDQENPELVKSIFYSMHEKGKTRGHTIKLKNGLQNLNFGYLERSGFSLEDFKFEGNTIKISKVKQGDARYTLSVSIVNIKDTGSDMKLEMTMENLSELSKDMGMEVNWDTMVNGQDSSPFVAIENGWVNFYNGVLVAAFFKDIEHTTKADAIAFGPHNDKPKITWEEHARLIGKKTSNGDGFADVFYDAIEVEPGQSKSIELIIGGINDSGTIISQTNVSEISSKNYLPGDKILLSGVAEDPDVVGNIVDVMCSFSDGEELKLGTLDLTLGAKNFEYEYSLSNQLLPGNYSLKLWAKDIFWAESNIVNYNIIIPANNNPQLSMDENPKVRYYKSGSVVVSGHVADEDGDDVEVSASIDGHRVTDVVYGGDGNFQLSWDIGGLEIADGTYTDITIGANDGNSGTDSETYTGKLIVDTMKPSGEISADKSSYTKDEINLTLSTSDENGIRKVKRPDDKWLVRLLSGESASDVVSETVYEAVYSDISQVRYTIDSNGEYTFLIEDFAGNQNELSVKIENIDQSIPSASFNLSPSSWTNGNVNIAVTGIDKGKSGIKRIKLPSGKWTSGSVASYETSENATYEFVIENNVGNQNAISKSVSNIDKSLPSAELKVDVSQWTNKDVEISINATDNGQSGVNSIELPGGDLVKSSKASYKAVENGSYTFKVKDEAGNIFVTDKTIPNIDKMSPTAPAVRKYPDVERTKGKYIVKIENGSDSQSGVKVSMYRLSGVTKKDWSKYEGQIEITAIGTTKIESKTIDNAGNESHISEAEMTIVKGGSSSGGGSSLEDVDGDIEVENDKKKDKATIDLSKDRDSKAPISLDTIKEMKESKKTIKVENGDIEIAFKPDSIQATQLKDKLEKELDKDLEYKEVKINLGANKLSSYNKEKIMKDAKIGNEMGLHDIGSDMFDISADLVKGKDGYGSEEKIERFNEPVEVSIDLDDMNLTLKDISKLTAVRFETGADGNVVPVKIGGKYDPKTQKFIFHTDKLEKFSVVKADEMLQIDLAIGKTEVDVNGGTAENDVAPRIINKRTMVPVRFIAENMGAKVDWNGQTRTVTIEIEGKKMSMVIDQQIEEFDTAPVIVDGRTLVPIRYISEKFGANVMWFPAEKKVKIVK